MFLRALFLVPPLLFLLYENQLSESVRYSSIAALADDTKIFKTIHNVSDASLLQEDIKNFEENSSKVNLILNAEKCSVLRITRKHHKIEYPYKLHDAVLENTIHERYLGVWTSTNLTWSKHVQDLCVQSTKMLGYVRRSTLDINTISVRRTLYLTLVRSKLCYEIYVWAPQPVELFKLVELLQRRASKFILDLPFICDASYSVRLDRLDLIPLCYWHEFLDLVFYFNSLNV